MPEIVANVIRNDRIESVHQGHVAVVAAGGDLVTSLGDPSLQTYMRSSAKPFQIMPLLQDGVDRHFGFTNKELAVIMASHNGEAFHIHAVESILAKIGLDLSYLKCGFHPPMHGPSANEHLLQNAPESPLYNNCSGKHSGMLAFAKFHDWPLARYLDPEHPVQKRIKETIALFSQLPENDIGLGVDGCSAPVFYLPVESMARMYARLAAGQQPIAKRAFDLMWSNPEMIAGTARFDTEIMRVTGGRIVSKVGAEGIRCVGVRADHAVGVALKIADGSKRASQAVILEALRQLELISEQELRLLAKYCKPGITNSAGIETGWISPDFELTWTG